MLKVIVRFDNCKVDKTFYISTKEEDDKLATYICQKELYKLFKDKNYSTEFIPVNFTKRLCVKLCLQKTNSLKDVFENRYKYVELIE